MTVQEITDSRFSSLTVMKAAHLRLVKRFPPSVKPSLTDLDEIEAFVQQGRATGKILDSRSEETEAQSLVDHWAGYLGRYDRDIDATLAVYDPGEFPDLTRVECPYRGLEAFQAEDSHYYFGREQLAQELAQRLERRKFLAVVGASGSGKSSLVLAGVVPAFLEDRSGAASLRVVPGSDPLATIAIAIGPLPGDTMGWQKRRVDDLHRNPESLPSLLARTGKAIVLVVDQFEEAFTVCVDASLRTPFEKGLAALIQDSGAGHRLILTVRSDYESDMTRMPLLWEEFTKARVVLLPLGPRELRDAIEGPARLVGLKFEEGLVDKLCADVNGDAAALPLLQVILRKLWESKARNLVIWDAYNKLGNGRVALGRTADEFYKNLIPQEQNRVKRVFIRLVRPAAGQEVTSNRVSRRNLSGSLQNPGWLDDTIEGLRKAGLVRVTKGDVAANDEIEVAHEALVRNWPTLVDWVSQERSTMTLGRRLEPRVEEWLRRGSGTAGLLDKETLAEVKKWREDPDATLLTNYEHLDRFIAASQAAIDKEEKEKEQARQREIDLLTRVAREQQLLATEQRLKASQFKKGLILVVALALVALASAGIAVLKSKSEQAKAAELALFATQRQALADRQRKAAEAEAKNNRDRANLEAGQRELADGKVKAVEEANAKLKVTVRLYTSSQIGAVSQDLLPNAEASLLHAFAAARLLLPFSESAKEVWQAAESIRSAVREHRAAVILHSPARIVASAFSPDGTVVLTASDDGAVAAWDAFSGLEIGSRRLSGTFNSFAWGSDGDLLAASGSGGITVFTAKIIAKVLHVDALRTVPGPSNPPSLAFSPDSRELAGASDGQVSFWRIPNLEPLPAKLQADGISRVAFSGNGYWLATVDRSGQLRTWDAKTGDQLLAIRVNAARELRSVAFKPDGDQIAVGYADGLVEIFPTIPPSTAKKSTDLPTGDPWRMSPLSSEVALVAYSNKRSNLLAAVGADGVGKVWNATDRRELFTFAGSTGRINSLAFSPDGSRFLTTDADGASRIWNVTSADVLRDMGSLSSRLIASGDRHRLGLWAAFSANVLDAGTGSDLHHRLQATSYSISSMAFGASGRTAIAWSNGDISVYDAAGEPTQKWNTNMNSSHSLWFSPTGVSLSSAGAEGIKTWNSDTGAPQVTLNGAPAGGRFLAYSPDGARLAASDAKTVRIWDAGSGEIVQTLQGEASGPLAFSPDGQRIVAIAEGNKIGAWNSKSGASLAKTPAAAVSTISLAFSPNGERLLTVSTTGEMRLREAANLQPAADVLVGKIAARDAVFLSDSRIAVLTKDGTILSLPVTPAEAMREALANLVRPWRPGECEAKIDPELCRATTRAIEQFSEGNRAASGGDREHARALFASALESDAALKKLVVNPSEFASPLMTRSQGFALRLRDSGLVAEAETLAGLGEIPEAANLFRQTGEAKPEIRAKTVRSAAERDAARALRNAADFLPTVDKGLENKIKKPYLEEATKLDKQAQEGDPRLSAQSQLTEAWALRTTDPEKTVQVYMKVSMDFPDLVSSTWNSLCWESTLAMASAPDQRKKLRAITPACEKAVGASPTPGVRDSRGLNLALVGLTEKNPSLIRRAIDDFNAYIAIAVDPARKQQRQKWIDALNLGQDPFSSDELRLLVGQ
jgi:WD40 repeat protein